jgi:hypothetical protein
MIKGEVNMSKIMSMFERLNLVEKTNQEKTDNIYTNDVNIQEEIQPKNIEEHNNKVEPQYSESQNDNNKTSDKADIKQNNKLTIQEIYSSYGVENSDVNTIFMLGNFIDAIPESLPSEVRKKSVISIVGSSNSDLSKLLADGEKRLDVLKQFSNDCYDSTTDAIEEYKKKITELKKIISSYEEQIRTNQTLLKEQNNIIKFEIDKIESVINFFNNGN